MENGTGMELATHEVKVLVQSSKDSPEIYMEVEWHPLISDEEIAEMGYVPAAYKFVEELLHTAELLSQGDAECEVRNLTRH